MHHHGKGVYSGTFSGTLNPALQDRHGRPKRDISTIIHILNDLLCATPAATAGHYRHHHRHSHATSSRQQQPTATITSTTSTTTTTTASGDHGLSTTTYTTGKYKRLKLPPYHTLRYLSHAAATPETLFTYAYRYDSLKRIYRYEFIQPFNRRRRRAPIIIFQHYFYLIFLAD